MASGRIRAGLVFGGLLAALLIGACNDEAETPAATPTARAATSTPAATQAPAATATAAATQAPTATATAAATTAAADVPLRDQPIFDGKTAPEFFAVKCTPCHGAERQGIVGPALLPERLTESNEFYQQTILNGRPGTAMPVWKDAGVTEEQAAALVDFIKSEPE